MTYRKNSVMKPPWAGWIDGAPSAMAPGNSFRQITNWMIRFNRITPFFQTIQWPLESFLGTNVLMTGRTYTDQQGSVHTVFIGNQGWGEMESGGAAITEEAWPTWYPPFTDADPFSAVVYLGKLFFDNGIIPLSYFQGDGNLYQAGPAFPIAPAGVNTQGDFPGACYFLGAFADRLLAINTVEPYPGLPGATNFPTRIRYSAVNNALEWDATIDASAGVFQISDAEDALTGWMVINQTGFAFRKNGITAINATASSQIPFYVENFSIGPDGVGCYLPYTLSAYGTLACFIAQDDVYNFNGGNPTAIGGNAKKSIFKDLASASSTPFARMVGSFGGYVDYLTYWIGIPLENDTVTSMWIYHFDDTSWINTQWPYGAMRCVAHVATA